ncbi:RNA polymerase sigma factor [Lentzea sp. NPDC004789]
MSEQDLVAARDLAVRHCLAAGASVEVAEDCAQEAVAAVLTRSGEARNVAALVSTIARRRHVDVVRRAVRERECVRNEQESVDPVGEIDDRLQAQWLVRSLDGLPQTTREVCEAVGRGSSREEIAAEMGITVRAVEGHLSRARKLLRRLAIAVAVPVVVLLRQKPAVVVAAAAVVVPIGIGALISVRPDQPVHQEPPAVVQTPAVVGTTARPADVVPPPAPPSGAPPVEVPSVVPREENPIPVPTSVVLPSLRLPELPLPELPTAQNQPVHSMTP